MRRRKTRPRRSRRSEPALPLEISNVSPAWREVVDRNGVASAMNGNFDAADGRVPISREFFGASRKSMTDDSRRNLLDVSDSFSISTCRFGLPDCRACIPRFIVPMHVGRTARNLPETIRRIFRDTARFAIDEFGRFESAAGAVSSSGRLEKPRIREIPVSRKPRLIENAVARQEG